MVISSRTPEGWPNKCPVCLKPFRLEPSDPAGEAPCPHCGSLVWFSRSGHDEIVQPSAFECLVPDRSLPIRKTRAPYRLSRIASTCGWLLRPLVRRWSKGRRERALSELQLLMRTASGCPNREALERIVGKPLYAIEAGEHRDEYFAVAGCDVVLRFSSDRLMSILGVVSFSSAEWGAGIRPDDAWTTSSPLDGGKYFVRRLNVSERQIHPAPSSFFKSA
jgi:hypothetical protein